MIEAEQRTFRPVPDEVEWQKVCHMDDIPPLEGRRYMIQGMPVAIFKNRKDEVFAIHDECPHRGGPLSDGIMHGSQVSCPLHDWTIDLSTGSPLAPDKGTVGCYQTRTIKNEIWLQFPKH
ncbi:MAG: nitrite reductase small subunit NirD [Pseudobacteriovorax sp.]|nr:nitrite reductase small subunit NirD [Pseudobacteriovorax sp.]